MGYGFAGLIPSLVNQKTARRKTKANWWTTIGDCLARRLTQPWSRSIDFDVGHSDTS